MIYQPNKLLENRNDNYDKSVRKEVHGLKWIHKPI